VCGLAAVLILFAHRPLLFEHGLRANTMDAAVVLSYCAGVYHFLAWRASERASRRRLHVVAVALAFVLGFMTKFVAALFLPLVLAAATLLTRDDRARLRRDWRAWCAASLLAAALIAPWFLYQYHRVGLDLLLLAMLHGGERIHEIPINWRETGQSKVSLIRDPLRMFWNLVKFKRRLLTVGPSNGSGPVPHPND